MGHRCKKAGFPYAHFIGIVLDAPSNNTAMVVAVIVADVGNLSYRSGCTIRSHYCGPGAPDFTCNHGQAEFDSTQVCLHVSIPHAPCTMQSRYARCRHLQCTVQQPVYNGSATVIEGWRSALPASSSPDIWPYRCFRTEACRLPQNMRVSLIWVGVLFIVQNILTWVNNIPSTICISER
jgi:hypothetical protein